MARLSSGADQAFFLALSGVPFLAPPWGGFLIAAFVVSGLIYGLIVGGQRRATLARLKQQHPNAPWFWREDWADGWARSDSGNRAARQWVVVVILGLLLLLLPTPGILNIRMLRQGDRHVWLLAFLCLLEALLLASAIYRSVMRRRFGKTRFVCGPLPFSPGESVTGQIHLRMEPEATQDVQLMLHCVRRITRGSGRYRNTYEVPVWNASQIVPASALSLSELGKSVPVQFMIPADALETSNDNRDNRILWRLHAKADVPGIDYSDNFEIPVFRPRSGAPSAAFENSK